MREVIVWDLPVRVFHWTLAGLVLLAYVSAEDEGLAYQVHIASGYGVGLLLAFRALWGVVGSRHARFADFLYSWNTLRDYVRGLLRLHPPHFVGHNPLGALMVFAMLAVLAAIVWTGLAAQGGDDDLHEALGNLIVVLAGLHVAGILLDWLLSGENLIRSMMTGRKALPEDEAAREAPPVRSWRAVAVLVAVALLAYGAVGANLVAWPSQSPETSGHEEGDENESS